MKLSLLANINYDVWYRGNKKLKPIKIKDYEVKFNNYDSIKLINNELYINNKLVSNVPDITEQEILDIYKEHLIKKGYKILNEIN